MRLCIGAKKRKNKSKKRARSDPSNSSAGSVGTDDGFRRRSPASNSSGTAVGTNDGSRRSRASNSSGNPRRRSPASNSSGTAVGTNEDSRRFRARKSSGGGVGTGDGSRRFVTRPTSGITASATMADILKIQENYLTTAFRRSRASNSSGTAVGTDGGSHPSGPHPRPEEYAYDESGNSDGVATSGDINQDFY